MTVASSIGGQFQAHITADGMNSGISVKLDPPISIDGNAPR